jgi:heme exporter protein D
MNQGYGNIGWEFFVYSSYIFVALSLILYVFISIISRRKTLKDMHDEGFFQNNQLEKNLKEDSKE